MGAQKVINAFNARGIYVLLDHHTPDCGAISERWYISAYSEAKWLDDLRFVANRYKNVPSVIGGDLKNEPHGAATWGTGNAATDWNKAAERGSAAVLAVAPKWIIAVEGITDNPVCSTNGGIFWGGNLQPLACTPLNIPANRLLLAPHVYGPDVFVQPYFNDSNFPNNMPAIWERHFGQFAGTHALLLGEFGGKYGEGDARDKVWQDALVKYLRSKGINEGFYWSWNPNSGGTGGILRDDWTSVREDKMTLLRTLWGTVSGTTPTPPPTPTSTGSFSTKVIVDSRWSGGSCNRVQVTNSGTGSGSWSISLPVTGTWNVTWSQSGSTLKASGVDCNRTLAAGATAQFGFCAAS